jgi:hypothetical protein
MPFLYIFLIILIFSALPVPVILMKRYAALSTVISKLKAKGFTLKTNRKLWFASGLNKEACELQFIGKSSVFSVKVIGFYSRKVLLNFISDRKYSILESGAPNPKKKNEGFTQKEKPKYDFSAGLTEEDSQKSRRNIILMAERVPLKITSGEGNLKHRVRIGDSTGEGEIYDCFNFLKLFD